MEVERGYLSAFFHLPQAKFPKRILFFIVNLKKHRFLLPNMLKTGIEMCFFCKICCIFRYWPSACWGILHNRYLLTRDLFPNITSFLFGMPKPKFFSIFQLPIFAELYHWTNVHQCRALITCLKHANSPYFGIVWVLFYNIYQFLWKSALNPKIRRKTAKISTKPAMFRIPGTQKHLLVMCTCGLRNCVMHHEYLMSSKAGNPAKDFRRTNAPTVGPVRAHECTFSMLKVKSVQTHPWEILFLI